MGVELAERVREAQDKLFSTPALQLLGTSALCAAIAAAALDATVRSALIPTVNACTYSVPAANAWKKSWG